MEWFMNAFVAVRDFSELGGDVLTMIAWTIFGMWFLIAERMIYFQTSLKKMKAEIIATWQGRAERKSWHAHQIREAMISRFSMSASMPVPIVQTLVALCPLLGLMGTVTGMIEVFDAMAVSGSSNARLMASGVSKATIPTMAGMVGALSGVFLVTILTRRVETEVERLDEELELEH